MTPSNNCDRNAAVLEVADDLADGQLHGAIVLLEAGHLLHQLLNGDQVGGGSLVRVLHQYGHNGRRDSRLRRKEIVVKSLSWWSHLHLFA